jgi:hypothetical protein
MNDTNEQIIKVQDKQCGFYFQREDSLSAQKQNLNERVEIETA